MNFACINKDLRKVFTASIRVCEKTHGTLSNELCRAYLNYVGFHRMIRDFSSNMLDQINLALASLVHQDCKCHAELRVQCYKVKQDYFEFHNDFRKRLDMNLEFHAWVARIYGSGRNKEFGGSYFSGS